MKKLCWLLLVLSCPLVCTSQRVQPDWLVIGVIGKWHVVESGKPVTFGMILGPDKSVMRGQSEGSSATFGSLTVLVHGTPVTYACDVPKTLPDHSNVGCKNSIPLSTALDRVGNSAADSRGWMESILEFISSEPARYYTAASRDAGTLSDGVLLRAGSEIDFKPSFSSLIKGQYLISIYRLRLNEAPLAVIKSQGLAWNPEKTTLVELPDVSEGVYQVRVETAETDGSELVGDVWILVAGSQDFAQKSKQFEDVETKTSAWGSDVPASGVRAVRRAALDGLSR